MRENSKPEPTIMRTSNWHTAFARMDSRASVPVHEAATGTLREIQ